MKKAINWMYSKDNPNKEKKWSKKIMLKHVLKTKKPQAPSKKLDNVSGII